MILINYINQYYVHENNIHEFLSVTPHILERLKNTLIHSDYNKNVYDLK